jgi:transcriptional regulator with XRE-family HTH domain
MSSILNIIGSNIKYYRTVLGLSQEKLAEFAGLHRTYIGAVERGERNISAKNIAKIAEVLGVEPYLLMKKESRRKKSRQAAPYEHQH